MQENENFDQQLKKGIHFFKEGKVLESKAILEKLESEGREDESLYFNLANIYHSKGELGKAIKFFNKTLEKNSSNTDASISLSIIYNDIGKYEEAKKLFDKASGVVKTPAVGTDSNEKINKNFSYKHFELAELYLSYGRFDEALFEFNKASGLDPKNLELRIKIAKVYAKKGFASKAFQELRKIKNENPKYVPARIVLGILFYNYGKIIEAENEWRRVLVIDPSCNEVKSYLNMVKTATETSVSKIQ
jgi:tetratricopeptide (TPR) repeat protein